MTGVNHSQPVVTLIDSCNNTRWTVPLTAVGLTVGRLDTNDVVLEDRAVSRRHLRLDWDGTTATVTDLGSTGGTSMDEAWLVPYSATAWIADQPVSVGRYTLQIQLPRVRPLDSKAGSGVRVFAQPQDLSVTPGQSTAIQLTIANFDRRVDHLNFRVEGVPGEWLQLPTRPVRLNPGAHETITVDVLVDSERQDEPGQYDVTIHVWSDAIPENRAALSMVWTLLAGRSSASSDRTLVPGLERAPLTVSPQAFVVTPGVPATVAVFIENQGAISDEFELTFTGVPSAWITLPSAPLRIDAGHSTTLMVQIYVPRVATSAARTYPITVISRALQTGRIESTSAQCTVVAFIDIALSIEPRTRSGRFKGNYRISLNNRGNDRAPVTLRGSAEHDGLTFQFPQPAIDLDTGVTATTPFTVRVRGRWHSDEVPYRFEVHAWVNDMDAGHAAAEYRQRPAVMAWILHRAWASTTLVAGLILRIVVVLGILILVATLALYLIGEIWDIDIYQELTNLSPSSLTTK